MTAAVEKLFALLDPPIWIVTARAGSRRGGLAATFVNPASIVPEAPRVVVGVAKQHFTWSLIEASGTFALHLLWVEQLAWVWRFGLQSGRAVDKFDGLAVHEGPAGCPLLTDALGWLVCRVEASLDTGDRRLLLAAVIDGAVHAEERPLTVRHMLERATAAELEELKRQRAQDAAADRAAITAWRRHLGWNNGLSRS